MIIRTTLLAAIALAVCATASAAPSPKALALRPADLPAGTKVLVLDDTSGPGGSIYAAVSNFKAGGREEALTDKVWYVPKNAKPPVPGLVAGPESTYRNEVGQISGFEGERSINLPKYGDEQTAEWADYKNSDGAGRAFAGLVVRKGNVIWVVEVESCGGTEINPGCVFGPSPPKLTEATAVAALKKYAAKQQARVG